jgi:3-dehydroquinate synthase
MKGLLEYFNLPVCVSGLSVDDILQVASHDKKMESGKLKFILLNRVGNAIIDTSVTKDELIDALQYILK